MFCLTGCGLVGNFFGCDEGYYDLCECFETYRYVYLLHHGSFERIWNIFQMLSRYNFIADEKCICPPLPGPDLFVLALHAYTRGVRCSIWMMSVFDYGLAFAPDGHL
jgi:hypothetical protein